MTRTAVETARIKRARRRLRGYFFGSGIILAFLYLIAAAFLIRIFGVELTRYWSTMMMAAGVLLGGTYAIIMFLWIGWHVVRRLINRQPIGEIEN
jgi:membrane protein YdbS with pleckstrin-like domain